MTVVVDPEQVNPLETPIGATLESLATCLCAGILASGTDRVCFCGVLPGNAIPLDLATNGKCKKANGMAYVRLVNTYPSVIVGQADVTPGNCSSMDGFDVEVGIFRCYPLMPNGKNPPPDVMLEAARLQFADERTMRKAISCCEWTDDPMSFITGLYIPQGPAGGVLGGVIPMSVQI